MAILITGGAGFIGAQLAREFLKRGEEIVIFDKVIPESLFAEEKRAGEGDGAKFQNCFRICNRTARNEKSAAARASQRFAERSAIGFPECPDYSIQSAIVCR